MIFDDVTSALDGRTLFALTDKVFGKIGILRSQGAAVVLATHAAHILRLADRVLLMNSSGQIIDSGSYEQLAEKHQYFMRTKSFDNPEPAAQDEQVETRLGKYQTQLHTQVEDLRRQKGNWRSYAFYLGAMGWGNFAIFVAGALLYVVSNAIFSVWLTWWAEDTSGRHGIGYWLGLYATWAVLTTLAVLLTPL